MIATMSAGEVMTLLPSKKRSTPDNGHDAPNTPVKIQKTIQHDSGAQMASPVPASPALSLLSEPRQSLPPSTNVSPVKIDGKQPVKKRTKAEIEAAKAQKELEKAQREAERQAKLVEKEEKRRQKEEENRIKEEERKRKETEKEEERKRKEAEKEEERLKKQAEKDAKQAERDAKQLQRDQEKAAKEAEKQKKVEEQEKKERAQLRMSNFFTAKPSKPQASRMVTSSSLTTVDAVESKASTATATDYSTTFLPFNIPNNANVAPINFFTKYESVSSTTIEPSQIMDGLSSNATVLNFDRRDQSQNSQSVEGLMSILLGDSNNPIDLTSQEYAKTMHDALHSLNQNLTYLEFHEDVRPPFYGSFTKTVTASELSRVRRNPVQRRVKVLNYDYDSEAEWEEPEEGEDIIGDEEDDESEDGDDDMAEFIDDENQAARRPAYIRDLPPVSSGLQWQDQNGKLVPAQADSPVEHWQDLQMCFLLVPEPVCVDPLSELYWASSKAQTSAGGTAVASLSGAAPRPALTDKTRKMNGVNSLAPKVFKITKTIPSEDMTAFKAAIQGQELTKVAMREHLKKLFPKLNKEAINNTLDDVAERESKKATAKWRIKS